MATTGDDEPGQVSFGGQFWRVAKPLVVILLLLVVAAVWGAVRLFGVPIGVAAQVLFLPVALAGVRFGPAGGGLVGVFSVGMLWFTAFTTGPRGVGGDTSVLVVLSVFLLLVGLVVGESVRALIVSHQKALARWWDVELTAPKGLTDAPPLLSDDVVRQMVLSRGFYSVFQPIYALDDGRLIAAEALARFDSEPPLPPSEWFGRAAELGLGTALEIAAVQRAVESAAALKPHVMLTVNVSTTTMQAPELVDIIRPLKRRVLLELTELEPVSDYVALRGAIVRLREAGALIAIDNVGASLTSLRHISRLAPDVIKLDAILTNDGRGDPLTRSLIHRLLRYGRDSGALLIAGGIEEPEDLARWRDVGVQAAQGYLLGRPGPLSFVDVFTFPTSKAKNEKNATKSSARKKSNAILREDDGLSQSQLDDPVSWRRDQP